MDIAELRAELTRRGITIAANAGVTKLQSLLDAAIAEEETAAAEAIKAKSEADGLTARQMVDQKIEPAQGKSGAGKAAAPAAEPSTAPATVASTAIPESEISEKVTAGLTREQAIEVITHQRAHDKALKANKR